MLTYSSTSTSTSTHRYFVIANAGHAEPNPFSACLYVESVMRWARYIQASFVATSPSGCLRPAFTDSANDTLSLRRRGSLRKWTGISQFFPALCWRRTRTCPRGFDCGEERNRSTIIKSLTVQILSCITPNIRRFIAERRFPPEPLLLPVCAFASPPI